MRTFYLLISGNVQRVGFRMFIQNKARSNAVLGWVRNMPDGRVEAVFSGGENNLKSMIQWVVHGPPLSQVDRVDILEEDVKESLHMFEIR